MARSKPPATEKRTSPHGTNKPRKSDSPRQAKNSHSPPLRQAKKKTTSPSTRSTKKVPSPSPAGSSTFGCLALKDLKHLRFYTTNYAEDNKRLKEINKHYQIVDVLGDGNCGPYVHLIAWMNICETKEELNDIYAQLTGGVKAYKQRVKSYRQKLLEVFSNEFVDANCGREFFMGIGLGTEDMRREELETIFANDVEYFPSSKENLDSTYQFSPLVSSLGLSLLFEIRVVLIMAEDIEDEDTEEYHQEYKTLIFDSREHEGNEWYMGKVVRFDGVYKIPDDELDESRTVELVYVNSSKSGHFMYAKRNSKMSKASMDEYRAKVPEEVLCEMPASTTGSSTFGCLALEDLKPLRFYTTNYAEDNKRLKEINKHYQIVDVLGDGNCGPYVHLIAWMNICETKEELNDIYAQLTGGVKAYKQRVKSYRQKLLEVFSNEFVDANCGREFFMGIGLGTEDMRREELETIFANDVEYFPSSKENLDSTYQFSPLVSSLGLSLLFEIRVVLIMAEDIEDEDTEEYHQEYKTLIFDSREHEGNEWYMGKVVRFDGVYKIPDDELDESRTVELVYVNSSKSGHFMYAKRNSKMSKASMDEYRAKVPEEVLCEMSNANKKDKALLALREVLSRQKESEFGYIALQDVKRFKFYSEDENQAKQNKYLTEVTKYYDIVDVLDDGNCGAYAMWIALMDTLAYQKEEENEMSEIFEGLTRGTKATFQKCIKEFRQELHHTLSDELVKDTSERAKSFGLNHELLYCIGIKIYDERDAIYKDGVDYFPDKGVLENDYRFNPLVASFGLSIRYHRRVILISSDAKYLPGGILEPDKETETSEHEQPDVYMTVIFDSREHQGNRYTGVVQAYDGVYVLPDSDFDVSNTVELLYMAGPNSEIAGHFMYLRRRQKMSQQVEQTFKAMIPQQIWDGAQADANKKDNTAGEAAQTDADGNKKDNKAPPFLEEVLLRKKESEFGYLALEDVKRFKFYSEDENQAKENKHLTEVTKHYDIVDVLDDGNCGPYAMWIALMDTLGYQKDDEAKMREIFGSLTTGTKASFQKSIKEFRQEVRKVLTDELLRDTSERAKSSGTWKKFSNALDFDFYDERNAIFKDGVDYFPDKGELHDDYQFDPYLASFGLSI